mmetsp:Transcript_3198/g.9261  ORF Transcript_3198/g.9261 Transcript_3198/m.9261 type:complete len:300 (+) Transcript_3198:2083-2982(+)
MGVLFFWLMMSLRFLSIFFCRMRTCSSVNGWGGTGSLQSGSPMMLHSSGRTTRIVSPTILCVFTTGGGVSVETFVICVTTHWAPRGVSIQWRWPGLRSNLPSGSPNSGRVMSLTWRNWKCAVGWSLAKWMDGRTLLRTTHDTTSAAVVGRVPAGPVTFAPACTLAAVTSSSTGGASQVAGRQCGLRYATAGNTVAPNRVARPADSAGVYQLTATGCSASCAKARSSLAVKAGLFATPLVVRTTSVCLRPGRMMLTSPSADWSAASLPCCCPLPSSLPPPPPPAALSACRTLRCTPNLCG